MNHPSQFKCIAITNSRADTDPPNVMTADALAAGGYTFNACELNGVAAGPPATAPAENPSSGSFSCTALPTAALTNGQVGWVTTAYRPYDVSGGYQRGCVNECAEFGRYRCPNFLADAPINPSTCQGQVEDYGKLQCACDPRFSGPHCDEGCPGDPADPTFALNDLFLDVSYASPDGGVHASQTGFWLCVKPVATAYSDSPLPFFADPTTSDGGYAVYGEIPLTRPTGEPACESDCELNTGYSIR